ncbi:preprotein translocase subunit SecD [Thermococcus thioreducens]|uniref:Protein-export membrane protein SecD n=1 Tax=Thermococcus thioreducens TaxID=277988 RepID=A0A0Q2MQE3_9EURY|nr:preprotein translocase subunit SecD [Thermococcus thioreducens]ASJ11491.1 preprotein translocase subunit SecD [Thermococcus thioreducens]KQH81895.1 preprotein translocase subunit SecD [Thermococcus thioreducens]SEW05724.1 preprotein translocase subunit SecD [Thermococcus thioreducens]
MKRRTKKLLLNWRIILLTLFLIGSIVTLAVRPLTFGIDISGGVALVAQTEHPVDTKTMQLVTDSLQKRLNTLGLRDITVEAQGDQIVLIKVANVTSPEEANQIKSVIESQGVFYMEFAGTVFGTGNDVEYVGIYKINPDNSWSVPFRISKSAAEKFAELAKGKAGWPVDMFLDPPVNSLMIVPESVYKTMNSSEFNANAPEAPTLLERITRAFNISVVAYANQSADEIVKLAQGKDKIVLVDVPGELQTQLEAMNITVRYVPRAQGESDHALIVRVLGLYGPYSLGEGLTVGEPQQDVQITGSAPDRLTAEQEASTIYTVLKSGSLPVKLNVVGMEFISPRLGEGFRTQALYAGIGALITVLLIVYFHYRKWRIAIPVASTSLFEAVIILGFAALIKWNLDLPSIAGIIAAIGTGVDQQIVITDELLGGEKTTRISRRSSMLKRMGRAFFVIFASAATTIAAMSFLLVYFVGTLKGFAFTTILGVLIGILITRPAYAEIAKYLLGED